MNTSKTSPVPAPAAPDDLRPTGGGFGNTGETVHADPPVDAPADEQNLDEALKETFPASDPISPSAAQDDPAPAESVAAPPPSSQPFPFPTAESVERKERDDEGGGRSPGKGGAA
jgi:hypothetical protein